MSLSTAVPVSRHPSVIYSRSCNCGICVTRPSAPRGPGLERKRIPVLQSFASLERYRATSLRYWLDFLLQSFLSNAFFSLLTGLCVLPNRCDSAANHALLSSVGLLTLDTGESTLRERDGRRRLLTDRTLKSISFTEVADLNTLQCRFLLASLNNTVRRPAVPILVTRPSYGKTPVFCASWRSCD